MIKLVGSFSLLILFSAIVFAQVDTTQNNIITPVPVVVKEDKPLKFNLNDDGSHWFQVTFMNQTWARYNQSNPGTMLDGENAPETFDIGLRRTRIQMFGQITDRTFIYFQFGSNNVNAHSLLPGETNRKVQAFFHDALCEYNVFKGKNWLKLGGGLTITNGLSRFSQPSIGTIATLDVPVFLQSTVDQTDEFSRKLSVYARGQVGKIDYRFSLSDPYPVASAGNNLTQKLEANKANFAGKGHHKQYQTYLMYQFFEHEGHTTPYMTGSYLGKKKVFNIATGAIYQQKASWHKDGVDTVYNDMLLLSLESYFDAPLNKEKGTALNLFGGFYSMNYGKNYIRMNGLMNPVGAFGATNSNGTLNGAGNAYPMFGTGNHVYVQAAYLMKKDLLGDKGTLQPFVSMDFAKYQAMSDAMQVFDMGVNWIISGHKSKISLDYQLRPIYRSTASNGQMLDSNGNPSNTLSNRAGSVIVQYQISF